MEHLFEQIQTALLNTGIPPSLQVFILAMLPVTELRAAIPIGITFFDMPKELAILMGVAGNMIPVLFFLNFLEPICNFLSSKSSLLKKIIDSVFERTRSKHSKKIEKHGMLFLTIFVAIPLPGSGAWTGSLIGFLFGFSKKRSTLAILIGLIIAGTILAVGSETLIKLLSDPLA